MILLIVKLLTIDYKAKNLDFVVILLTVYTVLTL